MSSSIAIIMIIMISSSAAAIAVQRCPSSHFNSYNGGTTGTDAVWTGVPILTLPLNKFAARSLLIFYRRTRRFVAGDRE
jgi:hypothetical protein